MLQARLRFSDIDWLDLRAIVQHSPVDSALGRALNPENWITPELIMLRNMEYHLSWLTWAKTEDAKWGRNSPSPIPLTDAERDAAKSESEKYTAQTVDETLAALGWSDMQLN